MTEDTAALVSAHMEAAQEDLATARTDLAAAHLRGCVNRAYYAVFHAGSALLATRGIRTAKHQGVWSNLDKEFLLKGLMAKSESAAYHELYAARIEADYKPPMRLSHDYAADLLVKAERFVAHAEAFLEKEGMGASDQGDQA